MPALSRNQRITAAIAKHDPGKLYARNKGMLSMSQSQLRDFASTSEKDLPKKLSDFSGRKKHESKFSGMRK